MHRDARKRRWPWIVLLSLVAVLAAGAIGFAVYVNDYYHADEYASEALQGEGDFADSAVEVQMDNRTIAFVPDDPKAGFVFYPGGKVEAGSYAPLMTDIAQHGILCVICPMPFNLAVFDIDAANGIEDQFPQVPSGQWYIGGHSLGGSMAAICAQRSLSSESAGGRFAGLVLLGSYSTADLANLPIRVLLVHGSNDKVMNADAYEKNKANLPGNSEEYVIEGGNRAQFGSYGAQSGDGEAAIDAAAQWQQTADIVADWMLERK